MSESTKKGLTEEKGEESAPQNSEASTEEIEKAKALIAAVEQQEREAEQQEREVCLGKVNAVLDECGFAMIASAPKVMGNASWDGNGFNIALAAPEVILVRARQRA